jgi:PAS domain S-box-containing protein
MKPTSQTDIPELILEYHTSRIVFAEEEARLVVSLKDVTERKRAEKEILSVARFPAENPSPVLRVARDGRLLYANRSSQRLLEHWHCAQAGQSLPEADCGWIAETLERGGIRHQEVTCGEVIYWLELAPIPEMGYVNIYGRDITERKRAEEVLTFLASASTGRADEPFFNTLARYLAQSLGMDFVCIDRLEGERLNARTVAVWCDGRFEDNLTYALKDTPCGDVVGKQVCCFPASVSQFFPRDQVLKDLRAESYVGVTLWNHASQPIGLIAVIGRTPLANRSLAEATLKMVAGRAASELERMDDMETLRASEERYRTLAETAQDIIYVIDREFRMTYINEYGARQFGRSLPEIIGRHLTELFPAETTQWQLADMADIFRTGESLYRERQLSTGSRLMWLDSRLVPIKNATGEVESILGISRDITEHKQVEGQRLRTQRLESIGTLAGGVAHDLNNALAPILMAAEMLRLEFPKTAGTYFDLIQANTQRGAAMVKQLLTFAKGVEGERLLIQPKHLLKEMEKLIGSTFPKNIQLKTRYAKDLRTILGDVTQFHQVLLNLCINARDAMPEGGTLTLEAENMELDTVYADAIMEAKPGHYVVWRVMDTGTGIPPEILDRIFDPFFTTKGPGKGTGLGLSTLIGIVKSHGGFVRVYSVPGKGSTFAVYLPTAASGADNTPLPTETDMPYRGHGETILVVDDETAVRTVLRAILTKLNFKVLTASDGAAALAQVTEQSAELRAVITDVHMSHMDGLSFVRVLKGRLPQVGIIVASGRLDEPDENEFKKLGVSALLGKPFTLKELVEALKTVFQK